MIGPLRSFVSYNNSAPAQPTILIDALGTTTAPINFPCKLANVDGYVAGAGYFQIFDTNTSPTTGATVPLKSIPVLAAGNLPSLAMILGPINLNTGLYFAMSSTPNVYTAVSTAYSVWGEIDEFEYQISSGQAAVGDLTTGVAGRTIWGTSATPSKRLLRVDFIPDGLTAARYFQIHAHLPSAGYPALVNIPVVDSANQVTLSFGSDGFLPFLQDSAGASHYGCYVYLSATTGTWLTTTDTMEVRALVK